MFYEKELKALKRANRFRQRVLYDDNLIDFASNDYLGLSSNKKILKKAYKKIYKNRYNSSKSSAIVNGYSHLHKKFEKYLCRLNNFEDGIILGSGFLANISLIESMVRKTDILFIDEDYHASGILASSIAQGVVVKFKHNNYKELSQKIKLCKNKRILIAL
jgi:8-amino-7-oxononanoate synthase